MVLMPASAAEIAFEEYGKQYAREAVASCSHLHHRGAGAVGNAKNKGKRAPTVRAASKSNKFKEMEEIMKSETVVYPSWDRYVIKRSD